MKAFDRLIDATPRWLYGVGAVACAGIIIAVGQRPAKKLPKLDQLPSQDKILHFLAYAGLAALVLRFFVPRRASQEVPGGIWAWGAVVFFPSLVGALDEVLQGLARRGRSSDINDWLADTLGGTLVLALALWHRSRVRRLDAERRALLPR